MTPLVCFCILDYSALTLCLCGVTVVGHLWDSVVKTPSSWTWCPWDAICALYVVSVVVTGLWLLFSHSLVGFSLWLADWESLCPPHLVCCCTDAARTKPNSQETNPQITEVTTTHNRIINNQGPILISVKFKTIMRKEKQIWDDYLKEKWFWEGRGNTNK